MAKKDELTQQEPNETGKRLDYLYLLMGGVVIVLFIGFASMYIAFVALLESSNGQKQATYQSLRDQVEEQNNKLDDLIKEQNP